MQYCLLFKLLGGHQSIDKDTSTWTGKKSFKQSWKGEGVERSACVESGELHAEKFKKI